MIELTEKLRAIKEIDMEIHIFDTVEEASQKAFEFFKEAIDDNAKVFGLATGSTPEKLYQLLRESDIDFSESVSINLDEYYGLPSNHPQSYHYFMQEQLFNDKAFQASYLPDGNNEDVEAEIEHYDNLLNDYPIDLQILGIGTNGHIGFNEPGTSFDSQTQLVDLTNETIEANKRFFESADDVPRQAISMGIGSIMQAKEIILMAFGDNKAQAIKDTVQGPVTEAVPASILQKHPNVHLILDKKAAQLL